MKVCRKRDAELSFGEDVTVSYFMGYNRKDIRLSKNVFISLSLR